MSLRFWLNASSFIAVGIFTGNMIRSEKLEAKVVSEDVTYVDRLVKLDIQYLKTERKNNLTNMGLDSRMLRKALKKMKVWEKKQKKIDALLEGALQEDSELVEKAFCIKNPNERPRYYASMFLLKEDKEGNFDIIDLKRVSQLPAQEWAETIPFEAAYDKLELREDPKIDSTTMFAAALISKNIDSILDEDFPWGEGSNWSWDDVKKQEKNNDIEEKVISYLALMHLFMESASNPVKRICFSE